MARRKRPSLKDPRLRAAIAELKAMLLERFPDTTFTVQKGYDPEGLYLIPVVDTDDSFEVTDVIIDRLIEMQVDEDLAVYVMPVRPMEREMENLRRRQSEKGAS